MRRQSGPEVNSVRKIWDMVSSNTVKGCVTIKIAQTEAIIDLLCRKLHIFDASVFCLWLRQAVLQ